MYLGCDHGTHQKNITPNQPPVHHVTPQTCLTNLHRLDPQVRRQVSPYKNWFKIHVTIFLGNANKPEKTFLRTMCFSCKFQNLYGQSYTTGLKVIFGTCMRPEYLHRLDAFLETKIRALDPLQPRHELTRKAQQRTKKNRPTKSRSHPAIGKSPWHNVAQKFDQTLWFGSRISPCLCILSNICSEKQRVLINRPLAQQVWQ